MIHHRQRAPLRYFRCPGCGERIPADHERAARLRHVVVRFVRGNPGRVRFKVICPKVPLAKRSRM